MKSNQQFNHLYYILIDLSPYKLDIISVINITTNY